MTELLGISWPGGSPENTGLIFALIAGAYLLILWFSAVVWTARDISQRTTDGFAQGLFTLIVVVFNFPGLLVYRVLRPPLTLQEAEEHELESSALRRELASSSPCPNPQCADMIGPDYLVCPTCGIAVRSTCDTCDRALDAHWRLCPWCATAIPSLRSGQNGNGSTPPAEPAQTEPAAPAGATSEHG